MISAQHATGYIPTDVLAAQLGIQPKTLRQRFCDFGHYFGLVPKKLPNRTLMWPVDSFEQLAKGGA